MMSPEQSKKVPSPLDKTFEMWYNKCKDAQVPPGSESVASVRGTARIPGRPDMFQKRYATLNS